MFGPLFSAGLVLPFSTLPSAQAAPETHITDEAALIPDHGEALRIDVLVPEGGRVSQGQPVMRLRDTPGIALVAPMAGQVARVELRPGRRLLQAVLFHDARGDRYRFDTSTAARGPDGLRALLQQSGLWRMFRSRPFGRPPKVAEVAAAIFVMCVDTRPNAAAPAVALAGREADFERGLAALAGFAAGPIFFCEPGKARYGGAVPSQITRLQAGALHPQGAAGLLIHRQFPARIAAPVWDIAAEDVADLGAVLETGYLPPTRLVAIAGDALRETRLVRCQPGADLRGLTQSLVRPGPHDILSGAFLDGRAAHWLAPRDRQVTVLSRAAQPNLRHWFGAALDQAAIAMPIIPTAALEQAMGGAAFPVAALIRALATRDTEAFTKLGGLSLVEEDVALADYVTGARPRLADQLRAMLNQIAKEEDAA